MLRVRIRGALLVVLLFAIFPMLVSANAWAAPATATLFPLATQGSNQESQDLTTLLKLSIIATQKVTLRVEEAPDTLDVPCIRSIFCLRELGAQAETPHLIVGLVEPVGGRLKFYLILYDSKNRRTERAVEKLMDPEEVAVRIPLLTKELLKDLPPLPPGTPTLEGAPKAPPMEKSVTIAHNSGEFIQEVVDLERLDLELLDSLEAPPLRLAPEVFGSTHIGAERVAGYSFLTSSLSLELRFVDRLALTLDGGQLIGKDTSKAQTFFLLTGGLAVDWYWKGGIIRPLSGIEVRSHLLAPTLAAWGTSLRGGVLLAVGKQVDIGAVGSFGVTHNAYLPDTVFALNKTLPVTRLELSARLRFR